MRRGALAVFGIAFLAASAPAGASTLIGSDLSHAATAGTCGFGTFQATNRLCVASQASQTANLAPGGLTAPFDGVIVKWRMRTGTTAPDVTEIRVGLRLLHGDKRGDASELVPFPLNDPGVHSYSVRLPINVGDRIGLDSYTTTNDVDGGDLPMTYLGPGSGEINLYSSTTGESPPNTTDGDSELLLQAEVEPDADHDGFGDESQDGCPTNPLTQVPCASDRSAPAATVSYRSRQDFITSKDIVVNITSSESGTATAGGTIEIAGSSKTYPLPAVTQVVTPNRKIKLHIDIPRKALKAAKRALRNHKKVKAVMTAYATDAAGNAGSITKVIVKPKAAKKTPPKASSD